MKSIFESLLHAKAFAALCAVLFVGMLGWGAYTKYAAARDAAQPRNHELRYGGVFKKSDGTLVAWVSDSETGKGEFVKAGEEIGGATIVGGDMDTLRVRLADGSEVEMTRGGDPVVVGQVGRNQQSTRAAGQNQQRVHWMPTEAEIQEIEKRDPDLAHRIREEIRRQ